MPYHPVVDRFPIVPSLDPATLLLFAAAFVASVLLTMRRPAYGAMLLIFVPPFSFAHAVAHTTIAFPKVVVLGTLVGLLAHPAAFSRLRDARPMLVAFAAVIVAIALSWTGAIYHAEVGRELLKWVEYLLFFATAYAAFAADPDRVLVSRAFVASIVLVCVSALVEISTGASSGMWIGSVAVPRIAGVLEGPNQLAGYLEIAVAFLAASQIDFPRRSTAAAIGFAMLTLLLTFSRAAVIGIVVVAIVLVVMRRRSVVRAIPGFAGGLAAGIAGVALLDMGVRRAGTELSLIRSSDTTGAGAGGVGARSELWRAAWYLFRRHPIFGAGAGNYELRLNEAGLYGVRTHANNWYLQALAEGGIILFAATLFFIGAAIAQVLPGARRSTLALAALAATCALAVHQLADYLVFFPKVAEPWIVLLAIGAAASRDTA